MAVTVASCGILKTLVQYTEENGAIRELRHGHHSSCLGMFPSLVRAVLL